MHLKQQNRHVVPLDNFPILRVKLKSLIAYKNRELTPRRAAIGGTEIMTIIMASIDNRLRSVVTSQFNLRDRFFASVKFATHFTAGLACFAQYCPRLIELCRVRRCERR